MGKKWFDASRIAKQPKLKKDIAKWLATCVTRHSDADSRPSLEDILYKGHRGFISYHENDLLRHFEKWHANLHQKLDNMEKVNSKQSWGFSATETKELKVLVAEGDTIMSNIVDEVLLG